jgi:hypothetical protein
METIHASASVGITELERNPGAVIGDRLAVGRLARGNR